MRMNEIKNMNAALSQQLCAQAVCHACIALSARARRFEERFEAAAAAGVLGREIAAAGGARVRKGTSVR
jgi:hypothetical protein